MSRSPHAPAVRTDMMRPLPSEIRRGILGVRVNDRRLSIRSLRERWADADHALSQYVADNAIWSGDVDAKLVRAGAESVDMSDPASCDDFLSRIDLRALEKQKKREMAVAAARLELESLDADITRRDALERMAYRLRQLNRVVADAERHRGRH